MLDGRPSSPEGPSWEENVIVVRRLAEREQGHRSRVEVSIDEGPVVGIDHDLQVRQLVLQLEQEVLNALATRWEETILRSPQSARNQSIGDGLPIGLSGSVMVFSAKNEKNVAKFI